MLIAPPVGAKVITVHPHACGECGSSIPKATWCDGSPPRLWGMLRFSAEPRKWRRFTPTPVGNASPSADQTSVATVHPHACGECSAQRGEHRAIKGSPPRLWGMLARARRQRRWRWFTPTPVGNARFMVAISLSNPVHPHACGECCLCLIEQGKHLGSPPRLWGMLQFYPDKISLLRFTPTPVGNAALRRQTPAPPTVHPHACGECRGM